MTAPLPQQNLPPAVTFDGRPELRQTIFKWLGECAYYCELGQSVAERGDDKCLGYAIRCAAAHLKAAIGTYNDLVAASERLEGGT
jgi:hypothetical protein